MKEKLVLLPKVEDHPRDRWLEYFGIGTAVSFSTGVPLMLLSGIFSLSYPEAIYGFWAGATLTAASVPGLGYFTLYALDHVVHH